MNETGEEENEAAFSDLPWFILTDATPRPFTSVLPRARYRIRKFFAFPWGIESASLDSGYHVAHIAKY